MAIRFRWVSCQIQQLSEPLSDEDLLKCLDSLPQDLDETYERMLASILNRKTSTVQASMVRNLFKWVVTSYAPVDIEVLAEAVLQEPGLCSIGKKLPSMDAVLDICRGLVKITHYLMDKSKVQITFVHFSVKEYLLSERIRHSKVPFFALDEELSHRDIAQISLSYIFLFDRPDFRIADVRKAHPLLEEASVHWLDHLNDGKGGSYPPIISLLEKFFDLDRNRYFIMWQAMAPILNLYDSDNPGSHLYFAIHTGNNELVKSLLEKGVNPNDGFGMRGYPIQLAVLLEKKEMVSLLVANGADVNLQCRPYHCPLTLACSRKDSTILDILLEHNGDPNRAETARPLDMAARHENIVAIRKLLKKGVDYESYKGGLLAAAKMGNEDIFNELVSFKTFQDLKDIRMLSLALYHACAHGSVNICKHLIEEGADINFAKDMAFPLEAAVEHGHDAVVELLLASGSEVDKPTYEYGSVLKLAARHGWDRIVMRLADSGADVECCRGIYDRTPLYYAVQENHLTTVKMLLQYGADKHKDADRMSAFNLAVASGYLDIVRTFILQGIDYEREGGRYGGFIVSAMVRKQDEVLELFLHQDDRGKPLYQCFGSILYGAVLIHDEKLFLSALADGEDVNVEVNGLTPLLQAVHENNLNKARMVLERGADVHRGSTKYGTPICEAASMGRYTMCLLLLEFGARLNTTQANSGTPLQLAVKNKGRFFVEDFLELEPDVNISEGDLGSPLLISVRKGFDGESTQRLLDHGANPNCHGGEFKTVLQTACKIGNLDEIWALIDAGADIDAKGEGEPSPVEIAFERGDRVLFDGLVKIGARVPDELLERPFPCSQGGGESDVSSSS